MHHVIEAEAGKLSKPECRLHPLIYGVRFVGGRVVPTESIQVPDRLSAGSPIRWIEASDLSDWAERRDGQDGLPELLSQLILATSGHTATVHFPSGDSVQFAGWDGRTDGGTVMNQPLLFDQLANAPYRNPLSIALRAFVSKAAARGTIAQRSWLMRPRGFAGELGALTGRDCAHSLTGTGSLLAWQLWRSTTLENEGGT
jgi:hypothetical protein